MGTDGPPLCSAEHSTGLDAPSVPVMLAACQGSPNISDGAPDLLAEWDWEANLRLGWQPDQVTLRSNKQVHWVLQDECKLGLMHRWHAPPDRRAKLKQGSPSPFPDGDPRWGWLCVPATPWLCNVWRQLTFGILCGMER